MALVAALILHSFEVNHFYSCVGYEYYYLSINF